MKELKNKLWFLDKPDEGGGGEHKGLAALGPVETPPNQDEVVEKVEEQPEPEPTPTLVDASAFVEKFGEVIGRFRREEAPREDKKVDELTPEEAKKLLNVFDITPEWIAKFDNLETRSAALNELRDGVVKHSDTITQYRINETVKSLEKKFSPALDYMKREEERQIDERFNKAYPDIADPGVKPLVKAVAQELMAKGKKYEDEGTLFKDIATGVEKIIQVKNPTFKLSAAGSNPAKTKTSANAIPVTTPGSGGGHGKSAGDASAGNLPQWRAAFAKK